ncbi:MAG: hypothetical protein HY305_05950 [Sphingobacteriales bacterium]|nr:hypothetical protein [Sphingobacteriales bacterium]
MKLKKLLPLFILFFVFSVFFFSAEEALVKWGLDVVALTVGNVLFFLLGVATFLYQEKALQNSNPNVFIRSVMSGMMLKMFVCVLAVLAYVLLMKDNYSKSTVFAGLFLYIIYLGVEVVQLQKLNNQKNA